LDVSQTREAEIALRGATIKEVKVTTLTASDIHAHNSFDNPRQVEPKESQLTPRGGSTLVHSFAPASVTRLQITLA
jgi:alpha-N-arabinofuranosidase